LVSQALPLNPPDRKNHNWFVLFFAHHLFVSIRELLIWWPIFIISNPIMEKLHFFFLFFNIFFGACLLVVLNQYIVTCLLVVHWCLFLS
jgi:hypothetical protein